MEFQIILLVCTILILIYGGYTVAVKDQVDDDQTEAKIQILEADQTLLKEAVELLVLNEEKRVTQIENLQFKLEAAEKSLLSTINNYSRANALSVEHLKDLYQEQELTQTHQSQKLEVAIKSSIPLMVKEVFDKNLRTITTKRTRCKANTCKEVSISRVTKANKKSPVKKNKKTRKVQLVKK